MNRFGFNLTTALASLAVLASGTFALADSVVMERAALVMPPVAEEIVAQCRATRCERLNLDGAFMDDFTVLNDMTHVTSLMVSYTNFDDLADVAGMTQLTELHIGQTGVTYLEGLAAFPNLEVVHAQGLRRVTDFTPLYQLDGLRELGIDAPADMAQVARMEGVQSLYLMGGEIADLSPLVAMQGLERLHIEAGVPADVQPLLEMPSLRAVTLNWFAVDAETRDRLSRSGVAVRDVPIDIQVLC